MNILKSHTRSLVAVCLVSLVLVSCIRHQRIASNTTLGTHHISVRPQCNDISTSSRQYDTDNGNIVVFYEYSCGDTRVSIHGNQLRVNGKPYGTVGEYDQIAIDYGKVRVNSEVREMR